MNTNNVPSLEHLDQVNRSLLFLFFIHVVVVLVHCQGEEKYLMSIVQVKTIDRPLLIDQEHFLDPFTIRLNLQGKFLSIDPKSVSLSLLLFRWTSHCLFRACEYLGYQLDDFLGQTFFHFVHPDDLPILSRAHQLCSFFSRVSVGQWFVFVLQGKDAGGGSSDPYRFLSHGQQWIFFQTTCQVQNNSWTGKPESYLCQTNLLSKSLRLSPPLSPCISLSLSLF